MADLQVMVEMIVTTQFVTYRIRNPWRRYMQSGLHIRRKLHLKLFGRHVWSVGMPIFYSSMLSLSLFSVPSSIAAVIHSAPGAAVVHSEQGVI